MELFLFRFSLGALMAGFLSCNVCLYSTSIQCLDLGLTMSEDCILGTRFARI